ncbi:MAG: response regulator [Nitrospirae bacterium]|nr:response regulator [Nitrospirota bacterium]
MRKKILIIAEEKTVAALFGRALEPRGFDVYVIGAPDKGIEKAIEIEPDLIFTDLIFHDSNGLKISKLLHSVEKLKHVPIVMLISHKNDLDPKYTSTLGVVDTIIKPLDEDTILSKTLAVLGPDMGALEDDPSSDEEPDGLHDDDRVFAELMTDQQEFVTEADRLIDQAILKQPDEKARTPRKSDDIDHGALPAEWNGLPEQDVAEYPDFSADPGPSRKENPFEEDQSDWKDEKDRKTFKDEFEAGGMKMPDGPAGNDSPRDLFEDEDYEKQTPNSKKKLLLVSAVLLVAVAAGLGAYQARRYFFPPGTVQPPPKAAQKEASKEVIKETLPDAKEVTPAGPVAKAVTPEKPAAKAVAPAGPVAEKQTPPSVKHESKPSSKEPASKEKAKPAFKFSVQAGYFENSGNAESLAAALKKKGYDAFVLKTDTVGKGGTGSRTFYRVLIGTFDNIKITEVQAKTLRQKEGLKVIIYRN